MSRGRKSDGGGRWIEERSGDGGSDVCKACANKGMWEIEVMDWMIDMYASPHHAFTARREDLDASVQSTCSGVRYDTEDICKVRHSPGSEILPNHLLERRDPPRRHSTTTRCTHTSPSPCR